MLGVTLNPAAPSTGMVEIKASPGATGVYIDKGVELYADSDEDGTPIVYQTVDPLYIVDTDISGLCYTDRKSKGIFVQVYERNAYRILSAEGHPAL